jgi:hypothetical protein
MIPSAQNHRRRGAEVQRGEARARKFIDAVSVASERSTDERSIKIILNGIHAYRQTTDQNRPYEREHKYLRRGRGVARPIYLLG